MRRDLDVIVEPSSLNDGKTEVPTFVLAARAFSLLLKTGAMPDSRTKALIGHADASYHNDEMEAAE